MKRKSSKSKETPKEQLLRFCRETNVTAEKYGHKLLWNVKKTFAIGTCDCGTKVKIVLDDCDELIPLNEPPQCFILRSKSI